MNALSQVDIIFRLDAGRGIGSGHFMRCLAYAMAAESLGLKTVFAVSDDESAAFTEIIGVSAVVLGGDKMLLGRVDGSSLGGYAKQVGAQAVVVDSYAVSDGFFDKLRSLFTGEVAFIDDQYTFAGGRAGRSHFWNVSHVVNYSFGADDNEYSNAYGGAAGLLLGPRFAPVRPEFSGGAQGVSQVISRVLVTSGATNPGRFLERVTGCCMRLLPDAAIDVVVGPMSDYDVPANPHGRLAVYRGVSDLSPLMRGADLAVSAAGSTLYELSRMGVPTIAIPIVENQIGNARGFAESGAGLMLDGADCVDDGLDELILRVSDRAVREGFSRRAAGLVDGLGPRRLIERLMASCSG